jgi:hypothetical protein
VRLEECEKVRLEECEIVRYKIPEQSQLRESNRSEEQGWTLASAWSTGPRRHGALAAGLFLRDIRQG